MKFYKSTHDERKRHPAKGVVHHKRRFFYKEVPEDLKDLFRIETIVRKPRAEFSIKFHVGNAGSETPWDGHLNVLGSAFYWGISPGRDLAQKLTTNKKHKYDGRDISLRLSDRRAYFKLWAPSDRWERGEMARWRDSSFRISPADILFGAKRYSYKDLSIARMEIDLPEGSYPVIVKVQEQTLARTKSKRVIEKKLILDVEAPKGIPIYVDHSGGWKGDRVYGFGVGLKELRANWVQDAKNAITAWALAERAKNGFVKPDPIED